MRRVAIDITYLIATMNPMPKRELQQMPVTPLHESYSSAQLVYEMGKHYPGLEQARKLVILPFLQSLDPLMADRRTARDNVSLQYRLEDFFSMQILDTLFQSISSQSEIYAKDKEHIQRLQMQFGDWKSYLQRMKVDSLEKLSVPKELYFQIEKVRQLGMGITFMGGLENYRKLFLTNNPNFVDFDPVPGNAFISFLLSDAVLDGTAFSKATMDASLIAINNIKNGGTIFYQHNPIQF